MFARGLVEPEQFLVALLALLASACNPPDGTISLAWDRVAQPAVTGYEIVYRPVGDGESETQFVEQTDPATDMVEVRIDGLRSCTEYHVVVKSVGISDRESPPTVEITGWARPRVDSVSVNEVHPGAQHRLIIRGDNFDSAAHLEFVNAGTTLDGFSAVRVDSECDCKRLVFDVTVASDAPIGAFYVDVVNRDKTNGRSQQMVAVKRPSADE
jgi:hypothetical protein